MGNALKDQGKLEEAIEAYNKRSAIKPDYAEAYNNMGISSQRARQAGRGDRGLQQSSSSSSLITLKPTTTWAMLSKG